MAISLASLPYAVPDGSWRYLPADPKATFPGFSSCEVQAGDRVTFCWFQFLVEDVSNNVEPDEHGYGLHLAVDPVYHRDYVASVGDDLPGPRAAPSIAMPGGLAVPAGPTEEQLRGAAGAIVRATGVPLSGTRRAPIPTRRVDLGTVWFPYGAAVTVQGGTGPGAPYGTILVTTQWDRQVSHDPASAGPYGAVQVRELADSWSTLTFDQVPGLDSSGAPTRLQRPVNATHLWTSDYQPTGAIATGTTGVTTVSAAYPLVFDNGPGTYYRLSTPPFNKWVPWGQYRYVYSSAPGYHGNDLFTQATWTCVNRVQL